MSHFFVMIITDFTSFFEVFCNSLVHVFLNYLISGMPEKDIYHLLAGISKALAHPIRFEVIDLLKEKEMSFGEICEAVGCLKSNLSQHLSSMVNKGILVQRKEGLNMYYRLSSKKVATACRIMREVLAENLEKNKSLLQTL